ncbi:hypothetical protein F5Y19DRAFT_491163 [Xylariaceae sp. FL1651]|nr:hypothetical protein F5Y19DRAFT_491163 [Xylariaceae sp. FL1651]
MFTCVTNTSEAIRPHPRQLSIRKTSTGTVLFDLLHQFADRRPLFIFAKLSSHSSRLPSTTEPSSRLLRKTKQPCLFYQKGKFSGPPHPQNKFAHHCKLRSTPDSTFIFVVGKAPERFAVDSEKFMRLSPYFHSLMTNGMKESTDRLVVWEDTDPFTFCRLRYFAYTGGFAMPQPQPVEETADRVLIDEALYLLDSSSSPYVLDFIQTMDYPAESSQYSPLFRGFWEWHRPLIAHLKLYIVADTYLIHTLKVECLHRVYRILRGTSLYWMEHIVVIMNKLVSRTRKEDEMRKLFARFLGCFNSEDAVYPYIAELYSEMPEIAVEVLEQVTSHATKKNYFLGY